MSAKSIRICAGAVLVLLLLFAALGPARWQVRTGLGWQFDHVAGYFAFAVTFSLIFRRPLVVGGILIGSAMLLEALQALTPDRCSDLQAAFYGAAGALVGAVVAELATRIRSTAELEKMARLCTARLGAYRGVWPLALLLAWPGCDQKGAPAVRNRIRPFFWSLAWNLLWPNWRRT
jgi:VanZ family protein